MVNIGKKMAMNRRKLPLACVLGDIDLVRPLGMAGINSALVSAPDDPACYSRFVRKKLPGEDTSGVGDESLLNSLLRFGSAQSEAPVLFYQSDAQLLFVSRYREQLRNAFRFVLASPSLIEDLVDKSRFQDLAGALRLPVPNAQRICPAHSPLSDLALSFPAILKPVLHEGAWSESWTQIAGSQKALVIEAPRKLMQLWPYLALSGLSYIVQEQIPGPESRIESYHVYVDQSASNVAEFTGRKIRTYPIICGHSTALEITDAADVRDVGREVVKKLELTGVAKVDFKRAPDGSLYLLEVNPRFSLWHCLGAVAGVNLPALVYADLVGLPRASNLTARPGVTWAKLWMDMRAARDTGIPLKTWVPWALKCNAKSTITWNDPMPFFRGILLNAVKRRVQAKQHGKDRTIPAH
jgi:D-aspartate ligase